MPRSIPILIILGLAIYSFFDVLKTDDSRIRRWPRTAWLVIVLVPVIGAALWFGVGRPRRSRDMYDAPRIISLKPNQRPAAPDDDPSFLRRLDEEAWRKKRDEKRAQESGGQQSDGPTDPSDTTTPDPEKRHRPNDGPAPGPGIAPAG